VGKLDENIISTEKNTSGTSQSIKLKYNNWFTRIMRAKREKKQTG